MICGGIWIVVYGIYAVYEGPNTARTGAAGAYGMYENHNDYTFIIIPDIAFRLPTCDKNAILCDACFLAPSSADGALSA